jgi:hypothetical protein
LMRISQFPLWIWIERPTIFGTIIISLRWVFIFFLEAREVSHLFTNFSIIWKFLRTLLLDLEGKNFADSLTSNDLK